MERTRAAIGRIGSRWPLARGRPPAPNTGSTQPARGEWLRSAVPWTASRSVDDPIVPLTAAACGQGGGYYFRREPSWVVRHVETLEMLDHRSAKRRLTIDLALPLEPETVVATQAEQSLYCVPIARLSKARPTAFIDLRDETGRSLPLLTLEENARISSLALHSAVRALMAIAPDDKLPEQVTLAADGLPLAPRPLADYFASYFTDAVADLATEHRVELPDRLRQVVTQLVENSYLWSVIRGRPGDRRVLKLLYTIELDSARLPIHAPRSVGLVYGGMRLETSLLSGPIQWAETVAQLRARVAARIGWDSIDIKLPDPVMQDPGSYHLQFIPPAGLGVDRIELDPASGDPDIIPDRLVVHNEHLYLRPARVQRAVPLSISMRVARRGFLNLSILSAAIICGALWAYQGSASSIETSADSGTSAAAALLVIPALLVLFATRPSEHPLASMLLSGMRTTMLVCGLIAGAAAAAIGGIRPTDSLAESLTVYAILESVCVGVIAIAYLDSLAWLRRPAERARRWWCSAPALRAAYFLAVTASAASVAVVDFAAHGRLLGAYAHAHRVAIVLLVLAAVCAYQIVMHPAERGARRRIPHGVRVLALAALAVAVFSADPAAPNPLALGRQTAWLVGRWSALGIALWSTFTWAALWLAPIASAGAFAGAGELATDGGLAGPVATDVDALPPAGAATGDRPDAESRPAPDTEAPAADPPSPAGLDADSQDDAQRGGEVPG